MTRATASARRGQSRSAHCGPVHVPDPVIAGDRLYLFMPGPCWEPYFTSTVDGVHWTAPRTIVEAPPSTSRTARSSPRHAAVREVRGGARRLGADDVLRRHPGSFRSSLYFLRYADGRFTAADGREVGTLADLPFRFDELDPVQRYSHRSGRAWPMDVAAGADGAPVIAYTALHGVADTFRYARWDGARWRSHPIAPAGATLFSYHNQGVTFDHRDPSRIVLSRTVDGQNESRRAARPTVARRGGHPPDARFAAFNIRPMVPRGLPPGRDVVVYVAGRARSFREYDTRVMMAVDAG